MANFFATHLTRKTYFNELPFMKWKLLVTLTITYAPMFLLFLPITILIKTAVGVGATYLAPRLFDNIAD